MKTIERRYLSQPIELKADEETGEQKIVGYGAIFESRSENLGGFTEVIKKGAFDKVLENDVRALFNHDPNFVLGRSTAGTLRLSVDDNGLRYEIDAPQTQTVKDLVLTPMTRGDITGSSFGFIVDQDSWHEGEDGSITRSIEKIGRLLDVSPVTYPAYPETDVALRSLNEYQEAKPKEQDEEKHDDGCEECRSKDARIARLSASLEIHKRFTAA
jgi:HK97 family phage prohead protease